MARERKTRQRGLDGKTPLPLTVGIIGSGVLLPDDTRRSSGHWVSAEAAGASDGTGPDAAARLRILLDCGSGTLHGMARDRLPWRELTHIVLSHFHTDHIGDLAPVLWALKWLGSDGREPRRTEPLGIVGPRGLRMRMDGLAAAFGDWLLEPGFPLHVHEVKPGATWADAPAGLRLVAHRARHTPEALAWRVEARDARVGYTGDTGPLPGLGAFFRGVEVLVAECAVPDGTDLPTHLSPGSLATMASTANPGLLIPVHAYPGLDPGALPDLLARGGYGGAVEVGRDGLTLAVGPGEVRLLQHPSRKS
ncbi:MAG: ribonuclease Z [Gemmatimonadales bacterium]|nr:MAG: ribonuclease Z [Gemmatimonadales bacterium]